MKVKQPLCYRFLGIWTLCGAVMMLVSLLLIGGGTFWGRAVFTLIGAALGFSSALIAWRKNKKLQWLSISYVMIVSAVLLPILLILCCTIPWITAFPYCCFLYCQVLCFCWPYTISSIILIFVINYFLIKKLTHDEKEEREFEEVWNKIAGQGINR